MWRDPKGHNREILVFIAPSVIGLPSESAIYSYGICDMIFQNQATANNTFHTEGPPPTLYQLLLGLGLSQGLRSQRHLSPAKSLECSSPHKLGELDPVMNINKPHETFMRRASLIVKKWPFQDWKDRNILKHPNESKWLCKLEEKLSSHWVRDWVPLTCLIGIFGKVQQELGYVPFQCSGL